MNRDYVNISIKQVSDNQFDFKLYGNIEDAIKSLAAAATQTIASLPKEYQQLARSRFLGYLNQATVEEYRKEM